MGVGRGLYIRLGHQSNESSSESMERCSNRYARGFIIDKRANAALNFELSTDSTLPPPSLSLSHSLHCQLQLEEGGGGWEMLCLKASMPGELAVNQPDGRAGVHRNNQITHTPRMPSRAK